MVQQAALAASHLQGPKTLIAQLDHLLSLVTPEYTLEALPRQQYGPCKATPGSGGRIWLHYAQGFQVGHLHLQDGMHLSGGVGPSRGSCPVQHPGHCLSASYDHWPTAVRRMPVARRLPGPEVVQVPSHYPADVPRIELASHLAREVAKGPGDGIVKIPG